MRIIIYIRAYISAVVTTVQATWKFNQELEVMGKIIASKKRSRRLHRTVYSRK